MPGNVRHRGQSNARCADTILMSGPVPIGPVKVIESEIIEARPCTRCEGREKKKNEKNVHPREISSSGDISASGGWVGWGARGGGWGEMNRA